MTPEVLRPTAPKVSHSVPYVQDPLHLKLAPTEPTWHVDPPIHPYTAAHNATYVSPIDKVTNKVPQLPAIKKQELAYHTMAPIYNEAVTKDVYDRAMLSLITVTQCKLLSLSLEVCDALPFALDDLDSPCDIEHTSLKIMTASFAQILYQLLIPPEGSLIILDPYKAYFNLLALDEEPEPLIIMKELSQIIAMSEEVYNKLALIYDLDIMLNMQSANGEIDKSLSLAHNIPFLIGNIVLYLQVYVIHELAYDILLGHPFDVLMESIIKNFANKNQTIIIYDPNTGHNATMLTLARGPLHFVESNRKVFHRSTI
ncbi:hypothetical protein EW146_g7791 [Bondarzewia mesenterica]|uniref:Uncharacterized protein n=1 Tax=Bondarzewia mesenterica TaxID=1095465 RepID=A0A4S4LK16_9AGAM|nr:hypothetical protein EW146_g7791 [Bondarzewia mesenterica]